MKIDLLVLFIVLSILNVIIQTIKSIATVKCNKWVAAAVNAIAYGLYTVVIVYTNADLALWLKVIVTAITNLIGVFVVKLIEEKMRKDKLWKVECTFRKEFVNEVQKVKVPKTLMTCESEKYIICNFYCATQEQSAIVKKLIKDCNGKYFASETKIL